VWFLSSRSGLVGSLGASGVLTLPASSILVNCVQPEMKAKLKNYYSFIYAVSHD